MPRRRAIDIEFPIGGVNKKLAYQRQPPYTTLDALNVRGPENIEGRTRGGSRPGIAKGPNLTGGATPLGDTGGSPINMMAVMRSTNSEGRARFEEHFSSALVASGNWVKPSWVGDELGIIANRGVLTIDPDHADPDIEGVVLDKTGVTDLIETGAPYTVSFDIVEINETNMRASDGTLADRQYAYVNLYLMLANTPSELNNVRVVIRTHRDVNLPGTGAARFLTYMWIENFVIGTGTILSEGGVLAYLQNTPAPHGGNLTLPEGRLSATVYPTNIVTATWTSAYQTRTITADLQGLTLTGNHRIGLDINASAVDLASGSTACTFQIDNFALDYVAASGGVPPEAVVAGAYGLVYRETTAGTLAAATMTAGGLNAADPVQAVDRLGKLYIADYGNRTRQTDGAVTIANKDRLTSATVEALGGNKWNDLGIVESGDILEVISVGAGGADADERAAAVGRYTISSVEDLYIVFTPAMVHTSTDFSNITFRVVRSPKVYDSSTNAVTKWSATSGSIPLGCPLIEIFRDRIVLGGDPENDGVWYMSYQGAPDNWNYEAYNETDVQRPFAGTSTDIESGQLPMPLTAIVAASEDYLLLASESEIYLMRGDPAQGGTQANISRSIGIGNKMAWCRTPDGRVVFLSRDGIYAVHPMERNAVPISRDKLPKDLIGAVSNTNNVVCMEYDVFGQGIHLFLTPKNINFGTADHWWFDWEQQAFFPVRLTYTHNPWTIVFDAKGNRVLLGCEDGYVRTFQDGVTSDDGTDITSRVTIGPIRLGFNGVSEGVLNDLHVVLDNDSGDAELTVHAGSTAENAFEAASSYDYTLSAGRNMLRPRVRGNTVFLKVSDSSGSRWALDSMSAVIHEAGRIR